MLPIYWGVCRKRIIELFYVDKDAPPFVYKILNIGFITISAGIKMIPGLTPDVISNLNGAIWCFFLIYLVPCVMRVMTYGGHNKFVRAV